MMSSVFKLQVAKIASTPAKPSSVTFCAKLSCATTNLEIFFSMMDDEETKDKLQPQQKPTSQLLTSSDGNSSDHGSIQGNRHPSTANMLHSLINCLNTIIVSPAAPTNSLHNRRIRFGRRSRNPSRPPRHPRHGMPRLFCHNLSNSPE